MYISQATAQMIVEEIGREIKERINFIDDKSYIIASTDPARIGNQHDGAKRIMQENLDELYITPEMETATTKCGLNLPIRIHGEIVGVIGITGEKARVMGYGNIVRRMTEIMLEDSMLKDERRYDRRVRYRFLEEWLRMPAGSSRKGFVERGERLGINVTKPRRAMVIQIAHYHELAGTLEGQRCLEKMEASVRHFVEKMPEALYLREPPRQICMVTACTDEKIQELAAQIADMIHEKYGERVFIGIGGKEEGSLDAGKICQEAQRAVECVTPGEKEILIYQNLNIEIVMQEIADDTMEEYLGKLFEALPEAEWEDYMEIISAYFAYEGSITQISEKLYIHKNMLQYKLKKLESITGVDIRMPSGAATYMIALLFYQKIYGENILR